MAGSFVFEQFRAGSRRPSAQARRGSGRAQRPLFRRARPLVREQGRLVSKDRFLDEVWRGVPVTDEALTRADAAAPARRRCRTPRFIETVPKHGYRFIARRGCASTAKGSRSSRTAAAASVARDAAPIAGTVGGGIARAPIGGFCTDSSARRSRSSPGWARRRCSGPGSASRSSSPCSAVRASRQGWR